MFHHWMFICWVRTSKPSGWWRPSQLCEPAGWWCWRSAGTPLDLRSSFHPVSLGTLGGDRDQRGGTCYSTPSTGHSHSPLWQDKNQQPTDILWSLTGAERPSSLKKGEVLGSFQFKISLCFIAHMLHFASLYMVFSTFIELSKADILWWCKLISVLLNLPLFKKSLIPEIKAILWIQNYLA